MFQERLTILVSVATAARFGGWTKVCHWVLGACAVSGRLGGSCLMLLLFRCLVGLHCGLSHEWGWDCGTVVLWGRGVRLCLDC